MYFPLIQKKVAYESNENMSELKTKLEDIMNLYKDKKVEKRKATTALEDLEPDLAMIPKKKKTGKEKSDSAITNKDDGINDENKKSQNDDNRMEVDNNVATIEEPIAKPIKQNSKSKKKLTPCDKKISLDKVTLFHLIIKIYIIRIFLTLAIC